MKWVLLALSMLCLLVTSTMGAAVFTSSSASVLHEILVVLSAGVSFMLLGFFVVAQVIETALNGR